MKAALKGLNDYMLRAISAYDARIYGPFNMDVPLEDRNVDFCVTLGQLRLLNLAVEKLMEAQGED